MVLFNSFALQNNHFLPTHKEWMIEKVMCLGVYFFPNTILCILV